eukprot:scaffold116057_cov63-Phaeocystis_antarctica.AAC.1
MRATPRSPPACACGHAVRKYDLVVVVFDCAAVTTVFGLRAAQPQCPHDGRDMRQSLEERLLPRTETGQPARPAACGPWRICLAGVCSRPSGGVLQSGIRMRGLHGAFPTAH